MSDKIFKKYKYDIALEDGVGSRLVTWMTGLMVFFVTLALTVSFALNTITDSWVTGLSGSLTIEIKPPAGDDGKASDTEIAAFDANIQKVLKLSQQHPAVIEGRVLSRAEILTLIEPWLGEKMPADLPLPGLIDIKLAKDADVTKLQSDILAIVPNAVIDSHTDTLDDVKTLVNTARMFVLLLTGVILTLAVISISGIVRSKFSIHKQEVETLHLIGASDEYIARQFRHHTLKGTLKGALIGVVCMLVTMLVIGLVTDTVQSAILPNVILMPWHWALLIISPVLAGSLVAHLTAQRTVIAELAKLP